LKWLGLRSKHIRELIELKKIDQSIIQPLGIADQRKLHAMLRTDDIQSLPEYAAEMQLMLEGKIKCELEALYSLGLDSFSKWIKSRLKNADYI
jgi:DNA topoisomerase VI subunit A